MPYSLKNYLNGEPICTIDPHMNEDHFLIDNLGNPSSYWSSAYDTLHDMTGKPLAIMEEE